MAIIHTSTIVFAGGQFAASMFNERDLVNDLGELDGTDALRVGPIGRYSFGSGKYQFLVTPDRIDLKFNGDDILPAPLIASISTLSASLAAAKSVVKVTGMGINCDSVFDPSEIGLTGREFCEKNLTLPSTQDLVGADSFEAVAGRFYFFREGARYDVKIEPHLSSDTKNLFSAVNAHQELDGVSDIVLKLGHIDSFRKYIDGLHARLTAGSETK